jgi:hypothetical protein
VTGSPTRSRSTFDFPHDLVNQPTERKKPPSGNERDEIPLDPSMNDSNHLSLSLAPPLDVPNALEWKQQNRKSVGSINSTV